MRLSTILFALYIVTFSLAHKLPYVPPKPFSTAAAVANTVSLAKPLQSFLAATSGGLLGLFDRALLLLEKISNRDIIKFSDLVTFVWGNGSESKGFLLNSSTKPFTPIYRPGRSIEEMLREFHKETATLPFHVLSIEPASRLSDNVMSGTQLNTLRAIFAFRDPEHVGAIKKLAGRMVWLLGILGDFISAYGDQAIKEEIVEVSDTQVRIKASLRKVILHYQAVLNSWLKDSDVLDLAVDFSLLRVDLTPEILVGVVLDALRFIYKEAEFSFNANFSSPSYEYNLQKAIQSDLQFMEKYENEKKIAQTEAQAQQQDQNRVMRFLTEYVSSKQTTVLLQAVYIFLTRDEVKVIGRLTGLTEGEISKAFFLDGANNRDSALSLDQLYDNSQISQYINRLSTSFTPWVESEKELELEMDITTKGNHHVKVGITKSFLALRKGDVENSAFSLFSDLLWTLIRNTIRKSRRLPKSSYAKSLVSEFKNAIIADSKGSSVWSTLGGLIGAVFSSSQAAKVIVANLVSLLPSDLRSDLDGTIGTIEYMIEEAINAGNLRRAKLAEHANSVRRQPPKLTKIIPTSPLLSVGTIRIILISFNVCVFITFIIIAITHSKRPDDTEDSKSSPKTKSSYDQKIDLIGS